MKSVAKERLEARKKRQARVRRQIKGTDQKPRLCVYRSLRYVYAQLISDQSGKTIAAVCSKSLGLTKQSLSSKDASKAVGARIAEVAKEKSIEEVVFDRNGYVFHGRVAAVAEGAREGGLKF